MEKLGLNAKVYEKYLITLNGPVMLKKWLDIIGTNNPKHQQRIKKIPCPHSLVDRIQACGACGSSSNLDGGTINKQKNI